MHVHRAVSVALALMMGTAGVAVAAPASASRAHAPVDFDDYDQAKVDELVGQGFSEGEALFIALTKTKAKTVDDDHVRITNSFPTGNQAVVDVRIVPDDAANPDPLKIKTSAPDGTFKFSVKYSVPFDAFPVEARPTFASGDGTSGMAASVGSFGAPAQGDDPHNVQVIIQGLVDAQRGNQSDDFLKEMDKKLKTPKLDKLNNKLKGAALVNDLLAMGLDLDALLAELDELEKCAKNPSDPLQRKANKENPADLERLVKEIAAVRAELQGNTAAGVIGTINNAASGFIQGAPGWLGYVIGPGTSWALENFKQVAQDRMNEIRKQSKCKNDLKVDAVLETLWHFTGIKCGGPTGKWELDATLEDAPPATGTQHMTFTLSGRTLSGTYTSTGNITVTAPGVGTVVQPLNISGAAKFNGDETGAGGGTLTIAPDSLPVTAGKFCTEVAPAGG